MAENIGLRTASTKELDVSYIMALKYAWSLRLDSAVSDSTSKILFSMSTAQRIPNGKRNVKNGPSQAATSDEEHLNVLKFEPLHIYLTLCQELYKWLEFLVALQKVLCVFSCSVISYVLSSVGPKLETKHGGIAEIVHYELSHNIFSL